MTLNDKIQLLSTISSSVLSIVSVTIAILSLKQTNKITEESNRANIVFFIDKNRTSSAYSLVIKNFGNSTGKLISIDLNPKLSYEKSKFNLHSPILTESKNIYLAPNQAISSAFPFVDYPDRKFDVTIKYETLNRIYTESYTLDLSYTESVFTTSARIGNTVEALKNINESIREVSDKLN